MGNGQGTKNVEIAAAFVRNERLHRGWTAQDLVDRLSQLAASAGDNLTLTQQAISFFETGKAKSIPRWYRYAQAAFDNDSASPGSAREQHRGDREPDDDDEDTVAIAVVDVAYGMGGTYIDDASVSVEKRKFSRKWLKLYTDSPPELLFVAPSVGDSMWPTIHDTDTVIVDRGDRVPRMTDKIWAMALGEVGMVKRLRPRPDGTMIILSDNPQVPDDRATDGELHIVGRVCAIVRKV